MWREAPSFSCFVRERNLMSHFVVNKLKLRRYPQQCLKNFVPSLLELFKKTFAHDFLHQRVVDKLQRVAVLGGGMGRRHQ